MPSPSPSRAVMENAVKAMENSGVRDFTLVFEKNGTVRILAGSHSAHVTSANEGTECVDETEEDHEALNAAFPS